jgi:hypothetical protein
MEILINTIALAILFLTIGALADSWLDFFLEDE